MSAYSEAIALEKSLPKSGQVAWQVGKMYNALLAAAKAAEPESVSLAALDALEEGYGPRYDGQIAEMNAESLRVLVAVIAAALKPPRFIGIA